LQEIEAVVPDELADAGDVRGLVEPLAEHRSEHGLAGAVRHRADEGGDRRQRGRLALAPADVLTGLDPDQAEVLAAVPDVEDLRHGKVVGVDGLDLHLPFLPPVPCPARRHPVGRGPSRRAVDQRPDYRPSRRGRPHPGQVRELPPAAGGGRPAERLRPQVDELVANRTFVDRDELEAVLAARCRDRGRKHDR
jgi:hypothetical protein